MGEESQVLRKRKDEISPASRKSILEIITYILLHKCWTKLNFTWRSISCKCFINIYEVKIQQLV